MKGTMVTFDEASTGTGPPLKLRSYDSGGVSA